MKVVHHVLWYGRGCMYHWALIRECLIVFSLALRYMAHLKSDIRICTAYTDSKSDMNIFIVFTRFGSDMKTWSILCLIEI